MLKTSVCNLSTSRAYTCSDFLLFITNAFSSKLHQHPALQINISLSGEIICADDARGNEICGHSLLIKPNQPHRITGKCQWQAVLLLADHSGIAKALQHQYLFAEEFSHAFSDCHTMQLQSVVLSLYSAPKTITQIHFHITRLLEILTDIAKLSEHTTSPRIQKVIHQIHEYRHCKISHDKLASTLAISKSHLSHLFRQETGVALRRYKLWQRTIEGTHLILQGKSITDASLQSGFSDTAHFSRSFKQQFGITPTMLKQYAQEVIWVNLNDT
jgi:AraC-like DNA-binding protein